MREKNRKILFVQPYIYFDRLGLEKREGFSFGLPFFIDDLGRFLIRYTAVVTCVEHSAESRKIVTIANTLGITTILVMDGVYDLANSYLHPFLVKRRLKLLDGSIKYSYIFTPEKFYNDYLSNISKAIYYIPKHAKTHKSNSLKGDRTGILITCATTPYFTNAERDSLVDLFCEVGAASRKNGVECTFRIFNEELLNIVEERLGHTVLNDIATNIDDCLRRHAVLVTSPSTVIINAVQLDMPVCVLQYRDSPSITAAGWVFFEGLDFGLTLKDMLSRNSHRLRYQKNCLPDVSEDLTESLIDYSYKKVHHLGMESFFRKAASSNKISKRVLLFFKNYISKE